MTSQMSLAGGGCPLSYPSRGSTIVNAMAVSSTVTTSQCNQFHSVHGRAGLCKESKGAEVKENGSFSVIPKPYSSGGSAVVPAGSSLQHPAVILYPREKVYVHWHETMPKRDPVGLWNAGNSCFLNSVLQCLTFTPPLANYFMFEGHKSKLISVYSHSLSADLHSWVIVVTASC